jgi:hypothetical protein
MAEVSMDMIIRAKDAAHADTDRFAQRLKRDQQKLNDELFAATHSYRERAIHDAEAHYAQLKARYDGDANMQVQIAETSRAKIAEINHQQDEYEAEKSKHGGGLGHFARLLGIVALVHTAAHSAKGLLAEASAEGEMAIARAQGSAVGILEAEKKLADANQEILRAVPLIGGALADALGGHEWLDEMLKNTQEAEKGLEHLKAAAIRDAEEIAVKQAQLRHAPASEIAQIRAGNVGQAEVDAAYKTAHLAGTNTGQAGDALSGAKKQLASAKEEHWYDALHERSPFEEEVAARGVKDAQLVYDNLRETQKKADAAYTAARERQRQLSDLTQQEIAQQRKKEFDAIAGPGHHAAGSAAGHSITEAPEIAAAARLFEQTRTPQERATEQQMKLNRVYQLGAIDAETYARAQKHVADELKRAGDAEAAKSENAATQAAHRQERLLRIDEQLLSLSGSTPEAAKAKGQAKYSKMYDEALRSGASGDQLKAIVAGRDFEVSRAGSAENSAPHEISAFYSRSRIAPNRNLGVELTQQQVDLLKQIVTLLGNTHEELVSRPGIVLHRL